ncbi:MAG TPA: hypothetical protein VJ865_00410, partial [Gemmatimonadaceae bacterium]|nr:hypothetical protein [Gemmatimonadaceae bacterium]
MWGRHSTVVVIVASVLAAAARAQVIAPGDSVTRQIAGHSRDTFVVALNDGDFAELGVVQRGLSVAVTNPDGSRLGTFDDDIQFVAEGAGTYRVV